MAEQSLDPEHPDPGPGEAGLGPGEHGDSIEDGRKSEDDKQGDGEQDSGAEG
jgi:hypothetical protein